MAFSSRIIRLLALSGRGQKNKQTSLEDARLDHFGTYELRCYVETPLRLLGDQIKNRPWKTEQQLRHVKREGIIS